MLHPHWQSRGWSVRGAGTPPRGHGGSAGLGAVTAPVVCGFWGTCSSSDAHGYPVGPLGGGRDQPGDVMGSALLPIHHTHAHRGSTRVLRPLEMSRVPGC